MTLHGTLNAGNYLVELFFDDLYLFLLDFLYGGDELKVNLEVPFRGKICSLLFYLRTEEILEDSEDKFSVMFE